MTDREFDQLVKTLSDQQANLSDKVDILQQTVEQDQKEMKDGLQMLLEDIRNK